MNSLMQCHCNQTTPIYAAAAAAAAGHSVDGSVNCSVANDAAAVFSSSSSSSFSRHHQQLANHRASRVPARTASQSTCLYSFTGTYNMPGCRHPAPLNDAFADALVQSPSATVSPLVQYETKLAHRPHTDTQSNIYGNYDQSQYSDGSFVTGLNGHCGTYKVEQPSPPTTPDTEPRQTETWNSSSHYVSSSSEQDSGRPQREECKDEVPTSEKDNDLAPSDDHQSAISDDDSADMVTDSTTTSSQQQQQQELSDNSSGDVRQTQRDIYPIYPWMTRVHSTHGKYSHFMLTQLR